VRVAGFGLGLRPLLIAFPARPAARAMPTNMLAKMGKREEGGALRLLAATGVGAERSLLLVLVVLGPAGTCGGLGGSWVVRWMSNDHGPSQKTRPSPPFRHTQG
jgi:hypothetical protein